MKRKMILPITLLLALTLVMTASASGTLTDDVNVSSTAVQNTTALTVASGGIGACNPTYTTYMKWSLTGVSTAANPKSTLTLRASFLTSGSNGNLALYEVSDVAWTEATITFANPPAVGSSPIATASLPTAYPQDVVFTGSALADYINRQSAFVGGDDTIAGPNVVSFAVRITGCTANNSSVAFYSRTGTTPPALNVVAPTAITLSTFQAADPAVNWPLIAGLGALVALAAGGVLFYRKRATTH